MTPIEWFSKLMLNAKLWESKFVTVIWQQHGALLVTFKGDYRKNIIAGLFD
jgi:hypothetical protein